MAHYKRYSVLVAAAGLILMALAPALPDTTVGSPRAVIFALAGGLTAAAVLLRGPD